MEGSILRCFQEEVLSPDDNKTPRIRHAIIREAVLQELMEYRRRLGLNVTLDPTDNTPFFTNRSGKHYLLSSLSDFVTKKLAAASLITVQGGKTTAHYFRHYFVRNAFRNGASVDRISKTIGHSISRITEENYLPRELHKELDVGDFVVLPTNDPTQNDSINKE